MLTREAELDAKQRRELFDEYGTPVLEAARRSVPLADRQIRKLLDRWWAEIVVSNDGSGSSLEERVATALNEVEGFLFADLRGRHPELGPCFREFQDPICEAFLQGLPGVVREITSVCWGRSEITWESIREQDTGRPVANWLETSALRFAEEASRTVAGSAEPARWLQELYAEMPWPDSRGPQKEGAGSGALPTYLEVKPALFGCLLPALPEPARQTAEKVWDQVPWVLAVILDQLPPRGWTPAEWVRSTARRFTDSLLVERARKSDNEAAGEIWTRYQKGVHAHVRSFTLRRAGRYFNLIDTEDIVTGVFGVERAYLNYDPLGRNLLQFLANVGTRRVIDALRRERPQLFEALDDPGPADAPEDHMAVWQDDQRSFEEGQRARISWLVVREVLSGVFPSGPNETEFAQGLYFWLVKVLGYKPKEICERLEEGEHTYRDVLGWVEEKLAADEIGRGLLPCLRAAHALMETPCEDPIGDRPISELPAVKIPNAVYSAGRRIRKLFFERNDV